MSNTDINDYQKDDQSNNRASPMSYVTYSRINRLIKDGSIRSYGRETIQRWSEMAISSGYTALSEELAEIAKSCS